MLWGTPLMNTSWTHWEQDGNLIIENFHPSWLYIQSSHWLHACFILRHACHHFILPPQIPLLQNHTIPIVTYFLGLVLFFLWGKLLGLLLPRGFGCRGFFFAPFQEWLFLCVLVNSRYSLSSLFCLYTIGDLLRHVKNAHFLASLVF